MTLANICWEAFFPEMAERRQEKCLNEKKTCWGKYWLWSANSRYSGTQRDVQCCPLPFSQQFMPPRPARSPAGRLLELIWDRQHWGTSGSVLLSIFLGTDQSILSPAASKGMSRTMIFIRLWKTWVKQSIQVDHLQAWTHVGYHWILCLFLMVDRWISICDSLILPLRESLLQFLTIFLGGMLALGSTFLDVLANWFVHIKNKVRKNIPCFAITK